MERKRKNSNSVVGKELSSDRNHSFMATNKSFNIMDKDYFKKLLAGANPATLNCSMNSTLY